MGVASTRAFSEYVTAGWVAQRLLLQVCLLSASIATASIAI